MGGEKKQAPKKQPATKPSSYVNKKQNMDYIKQLDEIGNIGTGKKKRG